MGTRATDLGITIGLMRPGPFDAITDVPGVQVGHATRIEGEGPRIRGEGPIRTGVTVVLPQAGMVWDTPLFAGYHVLSGITHPTGLEEIREVGIIKAPVAITSSWCVGTVCDALIASAVESRPPDQPFMSVPVVLETWDGILNDVEGQHVRSGDVRAALGAASAGPVEEGCVGGGTGMISHGFKGGIGTASRVLDDDLGGYTVGVLVQTNHGHRTRLTIDGVPVGRLIPTSEVPIPPEVGHLWGGTEELYPGFQKRGSIIVLIATDAPLLPFQCERLAKRATLGIGRTGGAGENWSGDVAIAFSTANSHLAGSFFMAENGSKRITSNVEMLVDSYIDSLFYAVIEATEEAIVNALLEARTMTGCDGITVHALPHDRLLEIMAAYGRPSIR